ncbi:MAG: gamma-glutamyl-phosphate reductase, partial [Atopobiaceae bacterium]|nr:gamma-glutamyl-phosphate reductase [Atopobiaceae bacterium]
ELLPPIVAALQAEGVEVRGTDEVRAIVDCAPATDADWDTEYLALIVSIKLVDGVDEAIDHINRHGSHHTDAIITEDAATAARFMQLVDSAGVYQNCSTRFADGFRYGFGAEVGISTSKLHARGPVGLEGLVTYKYKIFGSGQIVGDYASGKSSFHFKDL